MPSKKAGGLGGKEAELLLKKWLEMEGWTAHKAAATGFIRTPGGKSFCQSHDLFGALDILAFRSQYNGRGSDEIWGIQVTTQSGRAHRRDRVEQVSWPLSWKISIVSHETTQSPLHRGRKLNFWKAENLDHTANKWLDSHLIEFDKAAVEKHARENKG